MNKIVTFGEVMLRFNPEGFDYRDFSIDSERIRVINVSDDYEVTIQSKSILESLDVDD